MEEKDKINTTINIYGGTQQILPNATQAVQNFYGEDFSRDTTREEALGKLKLSPDAKRLSAYINNVEELTVYLTRLSGCVMAEELALVVVRSLPGTMPFAQDASRALSQGDSGLAGESRSVGHL